MSYRTLEVEVEDGRIRPSGADSLPVKARALLTIIASLDKTDGSIQLASSAGIERFLSSPDFPLSPEQFRASMEVDSFDQ